MRKIIVEADTKKEAKLKVKMKRFYEGGCLTVPVKVITAEQHPKYKGKYIVSVKKDKRFV